MLNVGQQYIFITIHNITIKTAILCILSHSILCQTLGQIHRVYYKKKIIKVF